MELNGDGHFSNQPNRRTVPARNRGRERKVDTARVRPEGLAGALLMKLGT